MNTEDEEEYVLFGDIQPLLLKAIDRVVERTEGERVAAEDGVKVWRKDSRELATGFSLAGSEVAKIQKDLYPLVLSEVRTIFVNPLSDYTVAAPYSHDLYLHLLRLHRHWVIVRKIYFLTALLVALSMTTLRLLIFSGQFRSYVPIFEFYSNDYVLGILIVSYLGVGSLGYWYMGDKVIDLLKHTALFPETIAMLVRLPQPGEIDLLTGLQKGKDDTSIGDVASMDRDAGTFLVEAISDHIKLPRHSLYALEVDVKLQVQMRELIHERGGTVLSVGQPSQILRALFNFRILLNIVSLLLIVSGLVIASVVCSSLFSLTILQYTLILLVTALVTAIIIRLLRDMICLWLERHLHFFAPFVSM